MGATEDGLARCLDCLRPLLGGDKTGGFAQTGDAAGPEDHQHDQEQGTDHPSPHLERPQQFQQAPCDAGKKR